VPPRQTYNAHPTDLNLYLEHVAALRIPSCGCNVGVPDYHCDIGYALFQVEKNKRNARRDPAKG